MGEAVEIEPNDANQLILDYLICEGDYEIAMEFSKESEVTLDALRLHKEKENILKQCRLRADIKHSINNGEMLQSMDLLKKYDAEFFKKHENILLELQKQHLVELIHRGQINEAFKYNLKYLVSKTKLNQTNNLREREKKKKLLMELGDIMSLIACRNVQKIPSKQRDLLSLEKRSKLSQKINRILLKKEENLKIQKKGFGESLLFENMAQINYYQDFLMNLGIKQQFERGKISQKSNIMSYNETNIKKVKQRHPGFGKNNKHRSNNDKVNGITNWVKLDNKYRLKIKNYLPFSFDTSKCQRFKLNKLKKYNVIHVCDK